LTLAVRDINTPAYSAFFQLFAGQ